MFSSSIVVGVGVGVRLTSLSLSHTLTVTGEESFCKIKLERRTSAREGGDAILMIAAANSADADDMVPVQLVNIAPTHLL